jgi:hypothetical protein
VSSAEAPLELKGEVIYRIETANNGSQRGIGIQFIDIEKDAAAQLTRFIEAAIRQN